MERSDFLNLVYSPSGCSGVSLAVAASRAGSVGFCVAQTEADLPSLRAQLDQLADSQRGARATFGARVPYLNAEILALLEPYFAVGLGWLVVGQDGSDAFFEGSPKALPKGVTLLAEVTDRTQQLCHAHVDGLVVKGNEAAGFVGEESSFILYQFWREQTDLPLFVHGGLSPQVCAGLSAMGAAGGVFDTQLLLLRETGLKKSIQDLIKSLSGTETQVIGDPGQGAYLRLLKHPRAAAGSDFCDRFALSNIVEIKAALRTESIGLEDPKKQLFSIGHDVALAAGYAATYKSVPNFLKAVDRAIAELPHLAITHTPICRHNSFAKSYDIEMPIIQGPMTRVSDNADFAVAVADGGALPTLAIAMMQPAQVADLIKETKLKIGDGKWGAGFLGFLPQKLFNAQMEAVLENAPDFAIIAGGRPDQAVKLEEIGVPCFLHLPSAKLLDYYLENGSRRFIFEGRECGGHVGPLSSFVLWTTMIDAICAAIDAGTVAGEELDCVFAGGLHDAFSSAFLQVLVAPLSTRGVKLAMIVGTAYVLTDEIVQTGAILPKYQSVVRDAADTCVLTSGPGHASRSMRSPFVDTFIDKQKELKADVNIPAEDKREVLDSMIMGTLRVASKGAKRSAETSEIIGTDEAEQFETGMYMIGQVASLRKDVRNIGDLHASLTDDATTLLNKQVVDAPIRTAPPADNKPLDVAIVGISAAVPGAMHKDVFWQNILGKVDSVDEIPSHRWDWRLYFDEDRTARDKIYSRWGGFMADMPFEPGDYGITPKSLLSVDPMQLMALKLADEALADAGYTDMDKDLRDRTAVMIGASGGSGDVGLQYNLRSETPRFKGDLSQDLADQLPEWSEDTFAGILINVVSGRITNRLDLGGPNYTTDAACASSLAAVYQAANELRSGQSRMAIAGGVDTQQSPFGFMCFSQTQALSPRGRCLSFDKGADGIAISEGIVMLVLKRIEDAEADGDRIYAVIKGVGSSSDGKGKALSAPEADGQLRAMQRAYDQAGYTPSDVQLFEAHGTGTVVGDSTELKSTGMLVQAGNPAPCRAIIGSVKTNIGHTKASAGIAGLAKVALSLHHKVLPPHRGVDDPNDMLANDDAPLYLLQDAEPWVIPDGITRRGSVSAFGFGGTNFHAALEEYKGEYRAEYMTTPSRDWPAEILFVSAADKDALIAQLQELQVTVADAPALKLRHLAAACATKFKVNHAIRATFVFDSVADALTKLETLLAHLTADAVLPETISLGVGDQAGKVAVLFSGQGSQYTGMHREAAVYLPEIEQMLSRADSALKDELSKRYDSPKVLTEFIYPRGAYTDDQTRAAQKSLTATDIAQPALGAIEAGLWQFLSNRLGLVGDMFAGHSYGEFVALHAAGALNFDNLMTVSAARGRLIVEKAAESGQELGTMLALSASRSIADEMASKIDGLVVANDNSPTQVILSGPEAAVVKAAEMAEAQDLRTTRLPVAAAFHSELMRPAQSELGAVIDALDWQVDAATRVFSNERAAPHGDDVCRAMADHLVRPVNFVDQVKAMHDAGARIFVEVGPKAILSKLVRQILGDAPHASFATDSAEPGMASLLAAVAALSAAGVPVDLARLFENRDCVGVKLADLKALGQPLAPSKRGWWINGSGVRRGKDPQKTVGLTVEDKAILDQQDANKRASMPMSAQPEPSVQNAGPVSARRETTSQVINSRKGNAVYDNPIHTNSGESDASVSMGFFQLVSRVIESAEAVALAEIRGGEKPSVNRNSHKSVSMRPMPEPATVSVAPTTYVPPAPIVASPIAQPAMAVAAPAPAVTTAALVETAPTTPEKIDLKAALLAVVSDKTGYDDDMLEMDQNIEADLGIDSIKRVDIVAGLIKALPAPVVDKLGDTERSALNEAKTLDAMLSILTAAEATANFNMAGADQTSDRTDVAMPLQNDHLPRPDTSRYIVSPRRAPMPADVRNAITAGEFVIIPSGGDVDKSLVAALKTENVKAHVLPKAAMVNEAALLAWVAKKKDSLGALAGLIHLGALGQGAIDLTADPTAWRKMLFTNEKAMYILLRDLQFVDEAHAISVTDLGGEFARDGKTNNMRLQGGCVGLLKSLLREDATRRCRAIDLDPSQSQASQVANIMAEIAAVGGRIEVGYPNDERTTFHTKLSPLNRDNVGKSNNLKVIVATGGARGITSETIRELGAPGVTFVLTGRSELPTIAATLRDDPVLAGMAEAALAKHFVKQDKLTIADGRRRARSVIASREMLDCIAALNSTGADVEYISMDATDSEAVATAFADLYARHGQIDGVVHGAGVIEDKLLRDIPSASWDRVVETKVIGMLAMMQHLRPETLKFFYAYTSVAGRYGNAGQTSYATANELMGRLCCQWQAVLGTGTQVKSMNWGPWGPTQFGAGMVTPETERKFRDQGVYLVHAKLGADLFREETLIDEAKGNVEVVFGQAPWEAAEAGRSRLSCTSAVGLLGDAEPEMGIGGKQRLKVSVAAMTPYLQDHIIDGNPVLPMAMAMEIMAQAVDRVFGGTLTIAAIEDARLFSGVVIDSDTRSMVAVLSQNSHGMEETESVSVKLFSEGQEKRPHYGARFTLVKNMPNAPEIELLSTPTSAREISQTEAYADHLFHGPAFQAVLNASAVWENGACIATRASAPHELLGDTGGTPWFFDPFLIDGIAQIPLLWGSALKGIFTLPLSFGRIARYVTDLSAAKTIEFRIIEATDQVVAADAVLRDETGRVLLIVNDMRHGIRANVGVRAA